MWFEQCLDEIGLTPYKKIAFPLKIVCGLAGPDWSVYNILIKTWERCSCHCTKILKLFLGAKKMYQSLERF